MVEIPRALLSSSTGIPSTREEEVIAIAAQFSALQRTFQRLFHHASRNRSTRLAHEIGGGRTKLVGARARKKWSLIGRNEEDEGKRCSRLCQRMGEMEAGSAVIKPLQQDHDEKFKKHKSHLGFCSACFSFPAALRSLTDKGRKRHFLRAGGRASISDGWLDGAAEFPAN